MLKQLLLGIDYRNEILALLSWQLAEPKKTVYE